MKTKATLLLLAMASFLATTAPAQIANITNSKQGIAYNANATAVTSASYAVQTRDHTLLVDATAANATISLPSLTSKEFPLVIIKKVDSTTHTVVIDPDGTQTIDGSSTLTLRNQHQTVMLHSDGSQWRWINRPTQGGILALTAGSTVSFAPDLTTNAATLTPAQAETIPAVTTNAVKGGIYTLKITTSGSSSYTLTFSTNFKVTGTLATGTASGKVFVVTFFFDGTTFNEVSRTAAM